MASAAGGCSGGPSDLKLSSLRVICTAAPVGSVASARTSVASARASVASEDTINNYNSNLKKILGFRKMQEKLKNNLNVQCSEDNTLAKTEIIYP